jgi:quercetin dioxygenase-like cupin family protein
MRHLLPASLITCTLALALPVAAQQEPAVVPIDKASFHWSVFKNEYVTLLRVMFPPGRGSNYHTHATDQLGVIIESGENSNQVLGEAPTPPRAATRGNVGFTSYVKKSMTHRSTNMGTTPFHNLVLSFNHPEPGRFTPGARTDVAGYVQVLDNERARAWRLVLEPGQSVAAITQRAPGIRIVVDGGEITESAPGEADRGQALRVGDFFWQDAGATRAVRNSGSSKIQIVEIEIK